MQTKLILNLDDSLIEQAKNYAEQHDKSLSQVVTDYFQLLTKPIKEPEISPITQSLIGVLNEIDKQDYKQHLEDKYL